MLARPWALRNGELRQPGREVAEAAAHRIQRQTKEHDGGSSRHHRQHRAGNSGGEAAQQQNAQ